jgi:DNA polymerase delta subunit 2
MTDCPHVYFAGNQAQFGSRVARGPAGQKVLLLSLPKFCVKKEIVIADMETMEVRTVHFDVVRAATKQQDACND